MDLRLVKRTYILIGTLFGLALVVTLISLFRVRQTTINQRNQVAAMFDDLPKLRPGYSTSRDIASIVDRYHGIKIAAQEDQTGYSVYCPDPDESYRFYIDAGEAPRSLIERPLVYRLSRLHYWVLDVTLQLKNGTLLCVSHHLRVYPVTGEVFYAAGGLITSRPNLDDSNPYKTGYDRSFHGLVADALPNATEEEKKSIFAVNLRCLTSFVGCHAPCELLPSVWKQYVNSRGYQHLVLGYGKPPDADDPRCK
jgi:hypothetical protein